MGSELSIANQSAIRNHQSAIDNPEEVNVATELSPDKLCRTFDPSDFPFKTTEELPKLDGIIGQPRALEALQFGLGIRDHTFHIYVAGSPGTGRTTAVQTFLEELARQQATPDDWCYVNNFTDSYRPRACRLPPGQGRELATDMDRLIERARQEIPTAFESDEYTNQAEAIRGELDSQRESLFTQLSQEAQQAGFLIQPSPMGLLIVPIVDGQPMSDQAFMALPEAAREEIRRRRRTIEDRIKDTMKEVRRLEREAGEKVEKLDAEVALFVVGGLLEDLLEKYAGFPDVETFLKEVRDDITRNVGQFRTPSGAQQPVALLAPWMEELPFRKYQVNVVVDNSHSQGAPVIIELNPTYNNLFGRMEKETQFGALYTDFTLIKAGSLHQANGGYLVMPIEEVLRNLFTWDGLKRALRNREIAMEETGERLGFVTTKSLRPTPIPLDVKVMLIGTPLLYHLLYALDEDFNELFKVKAHFDTRMDRTPENLQDYVAFMCTLCEKENLRHLDRDAVARLVEYGSRMCEDQQKLSTHFAALADVIREASYRAGQANASHITGAHVRQAIEAKIYRSNLIEERIREMIARGTLLIDTDGTAVGQVNGLSVVSLGDYAFGRPSRISVSVGLGRAGVVDIEREAKLGGPIHSKGVMILGGYLAQKYAQDKPLSLSARLVFEQSYEGVEGDSASSTELYALLSALSGLPIRQAIAVTGSVNQRGEIQAIGGVNEKIEGFFDVCRVKGLTGHQGVMIPAANEQHLMLREDVVEAVRQGRFHVWLVRTVDEGIELLTGVPAGTRDPAGQFPEGTVNARVDQRLRAMAEALQEFGNEGQPRGLRIED
jgi:lon-related putative ATP-dependent protease